MAAQTIVTSSAEETMEAGRALARTLSPPLLVFLYGELGAGKTTLAKGIISGLGAAREEEVTSPTFTLVHEYRGPVRVFHVDLYRIEGPAQFSSLGLDDVFAQPAVVLVEWPEKWHLPVDWPILRIHLSTLDDARHQIAIS